MLNFLTSFVSSDSSHSTPREEDSYRRSHKSCSGWLGRMLGKLVSFLSVPRHVAFILDGNRRYAKKHRLHNGHVFGFEKLHEALEWCYDVGIRNVTVYAFSIENFKRPKEEVELLMTLAKEKFEYMLTKSYLMKRNKVVVRVLGDLELLPQDLQILIKKVERDVLFVFLTFDENR